ncbi:MAG: methyltransferase domain-containing protein [Solirubrobacteraceae bacterium]|nr:methyltransferase domain-containing protein [Solirubrobacteraceae bacterium]
MSDLLERYRAHYHVPDEIELTLDDLRRHLVVELDVTRELLASTPETRRETFAAGYERIYRELWWFNAIESAEASAPVDIRNWVAMIGSAPRRVYEVGAGEGRLARTLARAGYDVTATDISAARGGARDDEPGLRWEETDGINLHEHAETGAYDAVISDQVVEHLHPDDLVPHLRNARRLLRPGGCYAMRTPHGPSGPYDSSAAFGFPEALATHLREYDFRSRVAAFHAAGYTAVAAERPTRRGPKACAHYARYLCAADEQLMRIPFRARSLVVRRVLRDGVPFRRNAILTGFAP